MGRKRSRSARFRVGKVTGFLHHGAWWLYYREDGKSVRRKVALNRDDAEKLAAQINGQAAAGTPTLLSFDSIGVGELRKQFLEYHELALKSSMGTVRRYRAATQHLEDFVTQQPKALQAHQVRPGQFATYLRKFEVAPNGHKNTAKRKLRDKGVQFILETCRSMYTFALKNRHLPPCTGNPFSELPLDRFKIEDAKPIFVFTAVTELVFVKSASDWAFPIHFTLAKTGLRIGELTHLLIEDLDLVGGWLFVRNKTELGWRVKTGNERTVPLLAEVVALLRAMIGIRESGPVFLRKRLAGKAPVLVGNRRELERVCLQRQKEAQVEGQALGRTQVQRVARSVWWDAGMVKPDLVRTSFVRIMEALAIPKQLAPSRGGIHLPLCSRTPTSIRLSASRCWATSRPMATGWA